MWWYTNRRGCIFRHKWVVTSISKQRFEVAEICSWCGHKRTRGLLPSDEEKQLFASAYELGRMERLRYLDELGYEQARGQQADGNRIAEIKNQHQQKVQVLVEKIGAKKLSGKPGDKLKIREIYGELRGLLFGKR